MSCSEKFFDEATGQFLSLRDKLKLWKVLKAQTSARNH